MWEIKLPAGSDAEALEALDASGLESTAAVPAVPSILPLPLMEGPVDPDARVEAYCASLHRLAPFRPSSVVCLTGPGDDRDAVVRGLQTIAEEAAGLGLRIGLEPINRVGGENWTIISSLPEAVELLEDADRPAIGIQFDTWHLWNTPDVVGDIERHAHWFVGVHVSDWRDPTRDWADRVLPGNGVADLPALLGAVDRAGWDGPYDLEIFSDNGTFGNTWAGSLWDVPPERLVRDAKEAFARTWEARIQTAVDRVSPGAV